MDSVQCTAILYNEKWSADQTQEPGPSQMDVYEEFIELELHF